MAGQTGWDALAAAPICPLMSEPTLRCERADEVLLGWPLRVLERPCPGWLRVGTHYGYTGFTPETGVLVGAQRAGAWTATPRMVVTRGLCDVLSRPAVEGWRVETLTRGALVAPVGPALDWGWQRIALPDGRDGYTKRSFLSEYYENPLKWGEQRLRAAIVDAGRSYLGTHYRWGGKSPVGIDCSGLTFMSYFLNGILIFRDARIGPGFPVRPIPPEQVRPADLLYFPGHVALYVGEGRILHSTAREGSDGVVISSLTPEGPDYRPDLAGSILTAGSIFAAH